ncbi:DNA-binding domain superfamily [Sesbania bispinosa]|nr:DNA-binding domain superfamily [Sesbania bispinosa]
MAGASSSSAADPLITTSATTNHNNETCSNNETSNNKMYKGVRKRKWGKWVSEIRLPNSRERIWLGSYDTQEKAARAFDAALYCLRGRRANFNFPDTPLNLEINVAVHHQSLSHQEIQEVAAKFANEPPMELTHEEEEEPSESQRGANSFGSFESNNSKSNDSVTESTYPHLYDYDGSMQVDLRTMDWTFSDMLDDLNSSDFSLYSEPDKMQFSGELLYSTQPTVPFFEDNNGGEIEGDDDAFSNHSFLWSWNF